MTSTLRPDEEAMRGQIERSQRQDKNIKKGIKTAAGVATAAIGTGISSRILPFLSEYIPTELAMKGIAKVSPKLGDFLQRGMSQGLDVKEGLQYIKDNLMGEKKAPDQRSIIEQYSPELSQFIQQHIQQGRTPLEAGALAQLDKKFKSVIKQMETDHKTPFSSILEAAFGSAQQPQQAPQQGMPQGQGQQGGQGQQALMAILQKIQQARGGM